MSRLVVSFVRASLLQAFVNLLVSFFKILCGANQILRL